MDPDGNRPGAEAGQVGVKPTSEARYEILEEVGRGGMGRVLRVRDRQLGRELAMKVIDPREVDPALLARFQEEAQLTSQLDHPSIVGVHDAGELEDGRVFYTMPLVDGRTLDEVLALVRAGAPGWSRTRVLHALLKACEAVSFAHAHGVVHRDLKPSNLMIGPHGEVLVMDWGLARRRDLTRGSTLGGTPATMAPEVLAGDAPAGRRADVYSFGAILYALCTGHLPYEDTAEEGAIERILAEPPTPIGVIAPTTPADLIAISEKAMARAPSERYVSMDELRLDLERFAEGRIVAAHPVGRVARVKKWARRHPRFAGSLVLVFVLLLALAFERNDKVKSVAQEKADKVWSAYVANLSSAEASLRMHEVAEAKRRLLACDEELRGWEWRHLWNRVDSSAVVLPASADGRDVDAIAASADGQLVVTGSGQTLLLWDVERREVRARAELPATIRHVVFGGKGTWIAAALRDGAIVRLSPTELRETSSTPAFQSTVSGLAVSPDGTALASCSTIDGRVVLHREGFEPLSTDVENPTCITFVDEHRLAVGRSNPTILLLDALDLSVQGELRAASASALAADPTGKRLAVGDVQGGVALIDLTDDANRRRVNPHSGRVTALAWDANGEWLASASDDKTIALRDATTGRVLALHHGHEDRIEDMTALGAGRGVATASADGTARLWQMTSGPEAVLGEHQDWVEDVVVAPDGEWIAAVDWSHTLTVRRASDGSVLHSIPLGDQASEVATDPTGSVIACAVPRRVLLFDVTSGAPIDELPFGEGHALALAWAGGEDGGDRIVCWTSRSELVLLSPDREPRTLARDLEGLDGALAIHPNGDLAVVGTPDGRVRGFRLNGDPGAVEWQVLGGAVTALAFHPAGHELWVGSLQGPLAVADASTGRVLRSLAAHDDRVTDIGFGPESDRVFTASKDRTVRVWHAEELVLTLRGHEQWVTAVDVSRDAALVASASQDGTVRLWRAPE